MSTRKILFEMILGGNDTHFHLIQPLYHQFLTEIQIHKVQSLYLNSPDKLVNEFYGWLFKNNRMDIIENIDRRNGEERRVQSRPDQERRDRKDQQWKQLGYLGKSSSDQDKPSKRKDGEEDENESFIIKN